MKNVRFGGVILAASLLSGCATWTGQGNVDALNAATPTGSPFAVALASEYKTLANFEWTEMMDYKDGNHYAVKGLAAAAGEAVLPDEMSTRVLPEFSVADISDAGMRLKSALDKGAATRVPATAAKAQAMYDCWMEQQEENFQPDHILACRKDFDTAMAQLGYGAASGKYMVFFDFNASALTKAASAIVKQAATDAKAGKASSFSVVAHTDTSGSAKYNEALSMARAKAVKSALIAHGVKASSVAVDAKGESTPLEATADGVKNPTNRRAEISFR